MLLCCDVFVLGLLFLLYRVRLFVKCSLCSIDQYVYALGGVLFCYVCSLVPAFVCVCVSLLCACSFGGVCLSCACVSVLACCLLFCCCYCCLLVFAAIKKSV